MRSIQSLRQAARHPGAWAHRLVPSLKVSLVAVLALGTFGCGSTAAQRQRGKPGEVRSLALEGRFEEAAVMAQQLAEKSPGDAELQALARDTQVGLLLERARRLSFADHDEAALEQVMAALVVEPESELVQSWRDRLHAKLADGWFTRGREAHAEGRFEAAAEGYRRAMEYRPGHPLAAYQSVELGEYLTWRSGQSGDYYNGGVRAFSDARLSEAVAQFKYSTKYNDGDTTRTARRITEVERERAMVEKALAEQQAAAGLWRSALRLLDGALALDPEVEGGRELRVDFAREAAIVDQVKQAAYVSLRGRHDEARDLLRAARAETKFQTKTIDEKLLLIDETEAAAQYQLALDLEHDFRFVEAVAAYNVLLEGREFYEDARSRASFLENSIRSAEALYGQAQKASSDAERLSLYRQIDLIWPEYRDVRDQLAKLTSSSS